jgi:putative DNA primase/helicase
MGDKTLWRRPGKDGRGWSATTGHCAAKDGGADLLAVFSSNAHPFEGPSGGRLCSCYGKFRAYALLKHGGDFKAAARELGRQGYGERLNRGPDHVRIFGKRVPVGVPSRPEPQGSDDDDSDGHGNTAVSPEPPADPRRVADPLGGGVHLTDRGNAIRMVSWHGNDLRHCHPMRKWLVWDGARWRLDDTAESTRRAKLVVVELFAQARAQVQEIEAALKEMTKEVESGD